MAQNNDITTESFRYTRVDVTALRYRLNKIPTSHIWSNLYTDDALNDRGIYNTHQLEAWLDTLRKKLSDIALAENPYLAKTLDNARKFNSWPKVVIGELVKFGEKDFSRPRLEDPISLWFKSLASKVLRDEGLHSIEDLKAYMQCRGSAWYRPIPRLGKGKAKTIEAWFHRHKAHLGVLTLIAESVPANSVVLTPTLIAPWVPLDRIKSVATELDGSNGLNRNHKFCFISARNDLAAIQAYLYKFREAPKTLRSYQKELERFLLWCVCVRRVALSSVLSDDCEAYKDFIRDPDPAWIGVKTPKSDPHWRPFSGQLRPESQKYAIQLIKACFEWLIRVRYLGGNPWATVDYPRIEAKELDLDIEKALPRDLWTAITAPDGLLDRACGPAIMDKDTPLPTWKARSPHTAAAQYRLARAAILLMGYTGIRRMEAAGAVRSDLTRVSLSMVEVTSSQEAIWELKVRGKGSTSRSVYLNDRVFSAIAAHWRDRGLDLYNATANDQFLLSPVVIMEVEKSTDKHGVTGSLGKGYTTDGLYVVVKQALLRMARDKNSKLTPDERLLVKQAAPHALRHTFASQSVAHGMPLDVLQKLLGHKSLNTTSLYVQAEKQRRIAEAQKVLRKF